jgi:hypothetical protein
LTNQRRRTNDDGEQVRGLDDIRLGDDYTLHVEPRMYERIARDERSRVAGAG